MKREYLFEIIIFGLLLALGICFFTKPDETKIRSEEQHSVDSLRAQIGFLSLTADSLKKNISTLDSALTVEKSKKEKIIIRYEKEKQRVLSLDADSSIRLLSEHLSE